MLFHLVLISFLYLLEKWFYYFHPKGFYNLKTYGYVGTIVNQIVGLIECDKCEEISYLYLGDLPIRAVDFVNHIHRGFHFRNCPEKHIYIFQLLAFIGDVLAKLNFRFPLTSLRLKNMILNYEVDTRRTIELLDMENLNLEIATTETIDWLRNEYPGIYL